MNIQDVRRLNLLLIANEIGRDKLAEKIGLDGTNYLNQVFTGASAFGNKMTERCYAGLDLPMLWLETPRFAEWKNTPEALNSKDKQLVDQAIAELAGTGIEEMHDIEKDISALLRARRDKDKSSVYKLARAILSEQD